MAADGRAGDSSATTLTAPEASPAQFATAKSSPRRGLGMALLLIAFAIGLTIGWKQSTPIIWPWLLTAAACLLAAAVAHVIGRGMIAFICVLASMLCIGAGWITLRMEYIATDDLAALIGDESTLVRLEGVATRAPELRSRTAGSMARFDYRPPATYFPMRVDGLLSSTGQATPIRGAVLVRVDQTLPPFRAGDRVQVTGFLLRPAMPRNPGEFDFRQYAKSLGQAGILTVSGRDLVHVTPAPRSAIVSWFLSWRDDLRRRASAWLLADLPADERSERDALLVSLLLGERDAEIDRVYESFQRVGLAHILAISGFHLAVLAGFVMFIARLSGGGGGGAAWHGWIVIAAVLLYLLLVEPRTPVLRAGVMTIAGCLGTLFGRRLRVSGLVALSAILLLFWRPDELFNPGFQLTYGVVLALIHLSPALRERWFGRPNPEAATSAQMLGEWCKTSLAASVVAWLVATPIAAYHFGSIALAGIPLSLIAVPLSAIILALGFMKIVLGAILPSLGLLLGVPLTISAELLLAIVKPFETLRLSSVHVPPPSTLWTFAAIAWVCWWSLGRRHERRALARMKLASLLALVLWLTWPMLPLKAWRGADDLLRIDMLAVGDGSCYVVRSGGETMVFDAGSSTDLNAGDRSIVPAMRRLGVRHVERLCISHANLDHYSAVAEIAREFDVDEVRLTPQFLAAAQADPLSPLAHLLAQLTERRVRVVETAAGATWTLGDCSVECLHPPPANGFERINDASMVLRISAGDRRALLCGDIQAEAMAMLMRSDADLHSDIAELPHHGSYHDAAIAFIERVDPSVVMQSTGWIRWQRDRWASELTGVERLVTVRDGACSVSIARNGEISVQRFLPQGVQAGGAEIE